MEDYALSILGVSIVISLGTAALVYFALSRLLVRPMMRITRNMVNFRQDPEDPARVMVPSGRRDEIGTAEHELSEMQSQLSGLLLQKTRLAQLGLAVSKINHDLRGMLANAQLLSDRLTVIPDPTVQRFAPKLIASLDRAINFCNDTLRYGRAEEAAPRRELLLLKPLAEEVGDALGLPREGHRLGARRRRHAAHRCRPRPPVSHPEQPRAQCAPEALEGQREHAAPGHVRTARSASRRGVRDGACWLRYATTAPAYRKRRVTICSRRSPARSAKVGPDSGLRSPRRSSACTAGTCSLSILRRARPSGSKSPDRGTYHASLEAPATRDDRDDGTVDGGG